MCLDHVCLSFLSLSPLDATLPCPSPTSNKTKQNKEERKAVGDMLGVRWVGRESLGGYLQDTLCTCMKLSSNQ